MNNALRFGRWLKGEIEERRVWVLLVVVVLAVLVSTYAYNVPKKAENTFVEPAGRSIGVFAPALECPSGWENIARGADPERGVANSIGCAKPGYIAYKNDQDELVVHDLIGNRLLKGNEAEAVFR